MRFLLSTVACASLLVVFACGGDDSGSGPTSPDGGSPDGSTTPDGGTNADGSVDPNACPGDTCGGQCGPCKAGKACKVDADCASNFCENDVCVQTTSCYPSGFCWENPHPTGRQLTAIRGSGPNDVWAVGDHHNILHWDGKRWRSLPSNSDQYFRALSFADATHGWAVGPKQSIMFWDGATWAAQANVGVGQLWDVFAISATDVWTVGDLGAVFHFDGVQWNSHTTGGLGRLRAVWAANSTDVWIAGDGGKIYKWGGGTTWTPETIQDAATPDVHALGGPSASTVFAGTYGTAIYARSGTNWSTAKTFTTPGSDWIEDIFALDGTHAYAAGIDHFERWNGSTWTTDTPPKAGQGFLGVWAASPTDVWLAGEAGELLHHDGAAWKDFSDRFTFTTGDAFSVGRVGITGIDAKSVIVVAEDGQVARKNGVTGKWTKEVIPDAGDKRAVSANGPNDIVAVGDDVHRWDGVAWKKDSVDSSGWNAITRVTPTTPWIVGNNGTIAKWNGMSWTEDATSGTTESLKGIWAADPMNVWAVGTQGVILHWNGMLWEKETSPAPTVDNLSVWGSSANDVWIGPYSGKLLHRVNGAWKEEAHVVGNRIGSIAGTGPTDVWFTGQSPAGIVHWDGASFTVFQHTQAFGTVAVVGSAVYLASSDGYILVKE